MEIDILNDEARERLIRGAETIPDNWSARCANFIKGERREVEKRYGIRFGQTEIYCARCGKSWGLGNHTCQDVRLQRLNEAKKDVPLSQVEFTVQVPLSVCREACSGF